MAKKQRAAALVPKVMARKREETTRTTFSLSTRGMEALTWLADGNLAGSYREVLDSIAAYVVAASEGLEAGQDMLELVAEAIEKRGPRSDWRRRTFTVGKKTVKVLKDFAKGHGVSRDELLDGLLILVRWFIAKDREELHQRQQHVNKLWDDVCKAAEEFERRAGEILPDGYDPVFEYFSNEVSAILGRRIPDTGEPFMETIKPWELP